MHIEEILNLLALFIAPIVAVIIGRWLQDRTDKRNDKMNVFKAVMTYRYTCSPEAVHALNSIPIVFAKDTEVRKCWKAYYEDLCIQEPNEHQSKKRKDDLFKLLESMAKVLGYKNSITWEDIQNPYLPAFMVNQEQNNTIIQSAMATLLPQIISQQQANVNNNQQETKGKNC